MYSSERKVSRRQPAGRNGQPDSKVVYLHADFRADSSRRRRGRSMRISYFLFILIFSLAVAFFCGICFGSILSNAETMEDKANDTFKYYRSVPVESGDSLWEIAQENMTEEYETVQDYIEEVCFINSIDADDIHAGHYLVLPYYEAEFR